LARFGPALARFGQALAGLVPHHTTMFAQYIPTTLLYAKYFLIWNLHYNKNIFGIYIIIKKYIFIYGCG
jgi:hypothetical protein